MVIQSSDYTYTVNDVTLKAAGPRFQGALGRAIANRKHGCRIVIGDPIQCAQSKMNLYVLDADGKECKLDIVRQERVNSRKQPVR